jgi:biopolymer transport protein ExbB
MEHTALHELERLDKHLPVLATLTGVAPLLGFFGTVVGMVLSFDAVAARGLEEPAAVAKGISVALLTTAWGLAVAIVTQAFHGYFASRVGAFTRQIEVASHLLCESLDEMEEAR